MKYKIIILALGVVLLAAACNKSSQSAQNTTTQPSTNQGTDKSASSDAPTPPPSQAVTPAAVSVPSTATIEMTSSGFSPSNITVTSGTTVVFKNTDTKPHWPASNPHPTHTDLPGFDALKSIDPGQSYSFTFTKVGTWGFHDHLNPTHGGHVTVQ